MGSGTKLRQQHEFDYFYCQIQNNIYFSSPSDLKSAKREKKIMMGICKRGRSQRYWIYFGNICVQNSDILQLMAQETQHQGKGKIDLIVIGNPNSGKTSLIRRFIDGQTSFTQFYTPTLGLTLEKKVVSIEGEEVTVCIWDTAGQEKFFSLTKNYFKKADGVLVVFDLTDKVSFDKVDKFWMPQIKEKSDQNCGQILIGNKKDMLNDRVVSGQAAKELSQELKIPYFQTSAKTGEGVQQAIQNLIKQCLSRVKNSEKLGVELKPPSETKSSCSSSFRQFFRDVKARFS